jgi:hypothetical protein
MTAPAYIVLIALLVGLILGVMAGMWIADQEWRQDLDDADRWDSRIAGPGMPTEEDEADELRKKGWL